MATTKRKFKAKAKRDIYQEVTDRIIEGLENGTAPWLKPWSNKPGAVSNSAMPHNAATGRAYSGINVILLWSQGIGYSNQGWVTYKQAADLGGQVKKGEKGSLVTLFKPLRITENEGTADEKQKDIAMIRGFTVFNAEQVEWPEGCKLKTKAPVPVFAQTQVTQIADAIGCNINMGGNKAFFRPSTDNVTMPHLDQFKTEAHFDCTLAHEITHWTGTKKRCDRTMGKRFGDDAYAFEELVAEIGSAFICAQLGIANEELRHNNEAYLASWIKRMKDDKKAIFGAASLARQSNEWVVKTAGAEIMDIAA